MNTVDGYEISSWERGYGDFEMVPDFDDAAAASRGTRSTALCLADLRVGRRRARSCRRRARSCSASSSGSPSAAWRPSPATELEFIVFKDTYEEAFDKGYRDLVPANHYNLDYSLLGTGARRAADRAASARQMGAGRARRWRTPRASATTASTRSTSATPTALRAADEHAIYKTGAKEIAAQEGMAITFMAKYDEREGSSCHIHLSLQRDDGARVFASDETALRALPRRPARRLRELTLFYAPNVNSYKRFAERLVRADRGRLGPRQPHVLAARRRPRRRAADRAARCPAPTSTRTWRWPR